MSNSCYTPELLAPAGNWECVMAAVANGANAVYFGLSRFNARLRADNFTEEDLPSLMNFLHSRNVRGFITMNTLIFPRELPEAVEYLQALEKNGVDGVIVQDIGLASLVKKAAPNMELHASTQMTISSREGLEFLRRFLPLDRAVLARELSLKEIGKIRPSDFPLEIFVHGALCVAYSGQCLTSESLGQRSANRGECAQACRMPYELVCDGRIVPLGEKRYLLSPQDLAAIDCIPEMARLGIQSFKIEGRLKSPEYVAAVTAVYRKALDAAMKNFPHNKAVTDRDRYDLQMVFSRGFSTGWLEGTSHPLLTHGRHGKKRGAFAGTIREVGRGWIELDSPNRLPLAPGDGFVFDEGEDRNNEQGGRIWKVDGCRLFFHGKAGNIAWAAIRPGMRLWKTDDPALNAALRKSWSGLQAPGKKRLLNLEVSGREGTPLLLHASDFGMGVKSDQPLTRAEKHPLTQEVLEKQLGRLGNTSFSLGVLKMDMQENLLLPLSALNKMRRELISCLEQLDLPSHPSSPGNNDPLTSAEAMLPRPARSPDSMPPDLAALCRSTEQARALLDAGAPFLYMDFEDIRLYRQGVALVREYPDAVVFLATPRIQKPGETGFFQAIERAEPDGVLIRNLGALEYFRDLDIRRIGDFSLNVSNSLTAALLVEQGRLERATISYDLNISQITDLLHTGDPSSLELVLHQHMPMFHMEHCVFCTFLSDGENHLNCGRPCEKHRVYLKDRVGQTHRLMADAGCRNTLYNGKAQTGASSYEHFFKIGLRHFRIDLLEEDARKAASLWKGYQCLITGEYASDAWIRSLNAIERIGVTEGTLKEKHS